MALVDLKQSNFQTWAALSIQNVYSTSMFSDVTLVTADDQLVQTHKIILSSSSEFFEAIFSKHNQPNPIIYLSGIYHGILKNILDFVYLGETQVESSQLEIFFETARNLKIKGITDNLGLDDKVDVEDGQLMKEQNNQNLMGVNSELGNSEEKCSYADKDTLQENNGEIIDVSNKTEETYQPPIDSDLVNTNYFDRSPKKESNSTYNHVENVPNETKTTIEAKQWINSSQRPSTKEKIHACNMCDYRIHRPDLLRVHMNSKHDVEKFACSAPGCVKVYSSRQNLKSHMRTWHECPQCDYHANSISDLKMHKKVKHNIQCL